MAWDDRPGNLGSYGGGGGNGNWGSTGGNYSGGGGNYMGGGGSYNYRTVPGFNSIGNWNTGGQLVNFDGSRNQGPIRSGPLPPARPNPANVRPAGVSTPMPGPSTPVPQFQGTMDDYNKWWGGFWNDFTNKWSGPTGGLGPAAFGSIGGTWNPVSGGPNGYVTSNTGEWNPVSRGPNGPRPRTSIY